MKRDPAITNLEQLVDVIKKTAAEHDRITVEMLLEAVGRRSFGPILLLAGLIIMMPIIGDIPGIPSTMGILVLLCAMQLVIGRRHFWLPQWIVRRSVTNEQLFKAIKWIRPPARFLDKGLRPRLTFLTKNGGTYLIAAACLLIAVMIPPMELIPFSANGAGIALTAFGLSLIAHDGFLALVALIVLVGSGAFVLYSLT